MLRCITKTSNILLICIRFWHRGLFCIKVIPLKTFDSLEVTLAKKRKRRKPLLLSKHSLTSKCYFFSATKSSLAFNFHSNFFVETFFKPQQKKVQKFAKLCTARHTLMLLLRRQIIIFLTFLFYLHLTKVELVKLPSVMSGSAFSTNLRSIFHLFLGL